MKKKPIAALICVLLAACMCMPLFGCSSGTGEATVDYSGVWVCTQVDDGQGNVTNVSDLAALGDGYSPSDFMSVTLNADGSASIKSLGAEISEGAPFTWSAIDEGSDKGVQVVSSANEALKMAYDSDAESLTIEYNGQKIILTRQQ